MSRNLVIAACVLLLLPLQACKKDEYVAATQVTVRIDSDIAALRKLDVEVQPRSGGKAASGESFEVTTGTPKSGQSRLPISLGIERGDDDSFRLIVTGEDADGKVLVRHEAIASFRDGENVLLVVFLASGCVDMDCADGETCRNEDGESGRSGGDASCVEVTERKNLEVIEAGEEGDEPGVGAAGDGDGDTAGDGDGDGDAAGDGDGDGDAVGDGDGDGDAAGDGDGDAAGDGDGDVTPVDPCDVCGPGERCVDGRCECDGPLEFFFRDADRDGFGDPDDFVEACEAPDGYVEIGGDCCDMDAVANPDQTEPQIVPVECTDAEQPFDYDCDGETFGYFELASGTCCVDSINGWDSTVPACGQEGLFVACNFNTCIPEGAFFVHDCL